MDAASVVADHEVASRPGVAIDKPEDPVIEPAHKHPAATPRHSKKTEHRNHNMPIMIQLPLLGHMFVDLPDVGLTGGTCRGLNAALQPYVSRSGPDQGAP